MKPLTSPLALSLALIMAQAPVQALAQDGHDADARAAATEAEMTDEERYQLLTGIMALDIPDLAKKPEDAHYAVGYIPPIPRLDVPPLYATDASLGVTNPSEIRPGDTTTALPSGLSLAAGFSPDMAEMAGAMIGKEARARDFNILLAGGSNLIRDYTNGRNFEYLSEDPLVTGMIAGASIRGVQSQKVVSTMKHLALNAQETQRMVLDARIEEAALRESDLLAFEIAIEQGEPGSVMCAYNKVNGTYACENAHLMNDVLKGDWGYKGWVMSDWGAVHSVDSFANGLDQQSGSELDDDYFLADPLKAEIAAGRVSHERLSDAARRILRSIYAVGADAPFDPVEVDYDTHAEQVRKLAASGMVLLKNDGGFLPLIDKGQSIAVIGGRADTGVLSGGGSSQVTPRGGATTIPIGGRDSWGGWAKAVYFNSSPLEALQNALPESEIKYDSGYFHDSAAAFAAHSDVAIVFATQWSGEALDGSMTLAEGQDALIAAVAAANPNTIVVLETGNPVQMPWLNDVKAVVEAWYPGSEGGPAIADVLTGAVNPSGRLPISFPASAEQLPRPTIPGLGLPDNTPITVEYTEGADVGYRWFAAKGEQPLFAFGHGLSYTSFEHSDFSVTAGKAPEATVTVRNTGERAGSDVVQVYLTGRAGEPDRRLVAFRKVDLKPGESRTVTLPIETRLLADWDSGGWSMPAGRYDFAVAPSAIDAGITAHTNLAARTMAP